MRQFLRNDVPVWLFLLITGLLVLALAIVVIQRDKARDQW